MIITPEEQLLIHPLPSRLLRGKRDLSDDGMDWKLDTKKDPHVIYKRSAFREFDGPRLVNRREDACLFGKCTEAQERNIRPLF